MHVNTQISRGLERLMARREGARLEGMFGLAGLASVDTFSGLAGVLEETGYRGGAQRVAKMRRAHGVMCDRLRAALPVAVDAKRLMEATGGDLSGIFSKIGKALKKVTKVAVKLSPSHALIKAVAPKAALLSPSMLIANRISAPKSKPATQAQLDAKAAKKAAKAAAKQAKADAKAAKKAAKAAAALAAANATSLDPTAAAAAVLANQSGVNLATPDAQAFAQEVMSNAGGGGGGAVPYSSMSDAGAAGGADDGTILGMSPIVAAGAGAAVLGGIYLLTRKRRRG